MGAEPTRTIRWSDKDWRLVKRAARQTGVPRGRFVRIATLTYMRERSLGFGRGRDPGPNYVPDPDIDLRESDIQ